MDLRPTRRCSLSLALLGEFTVAIRSRFEPTIKACPQRERGTVGSNRWPNRPRITTVNSPTIARPETGWRSPDPRTGKDDNCSLPSDSSITKLFGRAQSVSELYVGEKTGEKYGDLREFLDII